MANKQAKFTYRGLNQDVTKSKHPFEFYYEGRNIRVINTTHQDSHSLTNEKGNEKVIELPSITITYQEQDGIFYNKKILYGNSELPFINDNIINEMPSFSDNQIIMGHAITRDSIILLSTDDNGFDCVWEVTELLEGGFDLKLVYCRNLNFSINYPAQVLYNYENEAIQKIYWVDGVNQLRFLNIKHSIENGDSEDLINLNKICINIVGDYSLSQIEKESVTGDGLHTAGIIQYSYNQYKLNGSQTIIAPLSELISLDKGLALGGGELNEQLGLAVTLNIPKLDPNFNFIKIYAIKYTSYNQLPEISLIRDEEINVFENYKFIDSGNNINSISLSEFIFLGSNPIKPKHIESKDNRLLAANYSDNSYKLDIDMRAYSHNTSGATRLYSGNVIFENGALDGNYIDILSSTSVSNYNNYPVTLDAINPNYDTYKYQKDGVTIGGEGLFIKYELTQTIEQNLTDNIKYLRFFKDNEIYRIGIQFYNKLGQKTDVKWIADFKSPEGNLKGNYNTLKIELNTNSINNYIQSLNLNSNDIPVGYKILRAERNIKDRTILCQGVLTGMMVQTTTSLNNRAFWRIDGNRQAESLNRTKIPIFLSRGFINLPNETSIYPSGHLTQMSEYRGERRDEIYSDNNEEYRVQNSWQYTKMMQMYSPEVTFETGLTFGNNLKIKPKGLSLHTESSWWKQRINVATGNYTISIKTPNVTDMYPNIPGLEFGIIGPEVQRDLGTRTSSTMFNRQYIDYEEIVNGEERDIYAAPEITERGQGSTSYNGDSQFQYVNTLNGVLADSREEQTGDGIDDDLPSISSVNSEGAKCVTIVEGKGNIDEKDRKSIKELLPNTSYEKNALILSEIKRDKAYIYNGNLYEGLSINDKSRTSYIEIGHYNNLSKSTITIDNPGDTYVHLFRVGRILKSDTEVIDSRVVTIGEIIEFNVETTINLLNRNDKSLLGWDNKFQPRYDEFHKYNRVYSQSSNLIKNATDNINRKDINNFDTRIIASNLKIPGENVDSWTDFLENELIDVDGKYGPINSLVNLKDNIFFLQDKAVGKLSINPRIQTQGSDGVSIELGTGNILYDYNYLSTESGTLNKWSVFTSPNSFYYLDLINKSFNKVSDRIHNLSSEKGLHAYFQNNLDFNMLKYDNPILNKGVSGGYDTVNMNAFLTCLQDDKTFTISFNDKLNQFESFWDFTPSRYINKGFKLLTPSSFNNNLYSHFEGDYNVFYDKYYPSYIILQLNPESDIDCIFDNIEYNSELYLDDIDQPEQTLTHIQAFNEYQNSGRIPLIVGRNKNLRRKFRKWKANIPRDGRNRIRNPWIFLKLELDNTSNYKLILHDIILNYTTP